MKSNHKAGVEGLESFPKWFYIMIKQHELYKMSFFISLFYYSIFFGGGGVIIHIYTIEIFFSLTLQTFYIHLHYFQHLFWASQPFLCLDPRPLIGAGVEPKQISTKSIAWIEEV